MAEKSVSRSRVTRLSFVMLAVTVAFGVAGCNPMERLEAEWQGLRELFNKGTAHVFPKPSGNAEYEYSEKSKKSKANAELLREVYYVVYGREPTNRAEFGNYVDTLNQGASFEGVYNGFVHSSTYRKVEIDHPGSTYAALQGFAEELAILEEALPEPTAFTKEAAQPLAVPVNPGSPQAREALLRFGSPMPEADRGVVNTKDSYAKHFAGASIYILKRVLGDEAMKVVSSKLQKREDLARWYSQWVSRLAGKKVNFGLELRNSPEEKFHYEWAMKATEDQIRWEVLNRLHRLLNELNRKK